MLVLGILSSDLTIIIKCSLVGLPKWAKWQEWQTSCATSCGKTFQRRYRSSSTCPGSREWCNGTRFEDKDCPQPCPPRCIGEFLHFLNVLINF